jgi:hypothetical protein
MRRKKPLTPPDTSVAINNVMLIPQLRNFEKWMFVMKPWSSVTSRLNQRSSSMAIICGKQRAVALEDKPTNPFGTDGTVEPGLPRFGAHQKIQRQKSSDQPSASNPYPFKWKSSHANNY